MSLLDWARLGILRHLVRSPSVDNGFDEDPQVLPRLPGLVSFEADAQASRAAVVKRHLKRELLLSVFGNKDRQAGHFVLLGAGGDGNRDGGGERHVDYDKEQAEHNSLGLNGPQKQNKKAFSI